MIIIRPTPHHHHESYVWAYCSLKASFIISSVIRHKTKTTTHTNYTICAV